MKLKHSEKVDEHFNCEAVFGADTNHGFFERAAAPTSQLHLIAIGFEMLSKFILSLKL